MKIFCKLLFILFFTTYCQQRGQGQQIRIMTYNIHHGADVSEQTTLDSMAYYIGNARIDVVGLQEVDSMCLRSGIVDQPARLGELSGMDHCFTRHFSYQGGAYGQGLLSSIAVTNIRNFRLPVFPLEDGKEVSVLLADLHPGPDKKLTIGVVHLDYRSSQSRIHQIDLLLESLSDIKNLVLLGDFNAYPGSPEMLKLMQYFNRYEIDRDPPTFPAINPDRRIDFVLVNKESDLRIVDEFVDQIPYSDHLPVITTLEWE